MPTAVLSGPMHPPHTDAMRCFFQPTILTFHYPSIRSEINHSTGCRGRPVPGNEKKSARHSRCNPVLRESDGTNALTGSSPSRQSLHTRNYPPSTSPVHGAGPRTQEAWACTRLQSDLNVKVEAPSCHSKRRVELFALKSPFQRQSHADDWVIASCVASHLSCLLRFSFSLRLQQQG